jgi:hypothetical protein
MVAPYRNEPTVRAMSEADLLLQKILEAGDVVGRDAAGRTVIQLAMEPEDFLRLMAFGADAAESECDDGEPNDVPPVSACWLDLAQPGAGKVMARFFRPARFLHRAEKVSLKPAGDACQDGQRRRFRLCRAEHLAA